MAVATATRMGDFVDGGGDTVLLDEHFDGERVLSSTGGVSDAAFTGDGGGDIKRLVCVKIRPAFEVPARGPGVAFFLFLTGFVGVSSSWSSGTSQDSPFRHVSPSEHDHVAGIMSGSM
jgi:hypothetical protein